MWNEILEAGKEFGVVPCGLGARNTLRLEAKLPLYGHEISDTINVWEAGLDRFCKMEKPDFIGRAALEKAKAEGTKRALVGLEMVDRGIARDGYKVLDLIGPRDRLRHQRIARAVSEEEYRAGVCAARVRCFGYRTESRNSRAGSEGASGADAVLQEAEKDLTTEDTEKHRGTREARS